ncbi:S-adenosyl-L-methionine-dependent methyltransferase [Acrasis kona]|uniref:S-adenosyl-L-methionine-dependent methyltransferase n=1 Tax=Acrasis kona TaxID=1008807 RepID=A0AAW2YS85_9EUKA
MVDVSWRTLYATWIRFFMGNRLAPYHGTPEKTMRQILNIASVKRGDHFIDLGCGDGRFLIEAAKKGAKATGYELNPEIAELARNNVKASSYAESITIHEKDLRDADLSDGSVVVLYLSESGNIKLLPLLNKYLSSKPSARIVTLVFPIKTYTPIRTELTDEGVPIMLFNGESLPKDLKM